MSTALDTAVTGVPGPDEWLIDLFVNGIPSPQGSKAYFGKGRSREMSPGLEAWREDIRRAVKELWAGRPPLTDALVMELRTVRQRPLSAPKTKTHPAKTRPDVDKILRGVFDAITSAGFWRDDSLVVDVHVTKRIAEPHEAPGALVRVRLLRDGEVV